MVSRGFRGLISFKFFVPLAVAVWDYETITDLDATAVPLGYV